MVVLEMKANLLPTNDHMVLLFSTNSDTGTEVKMKSYHASFHRNKQ